MSVAAISSTPAYAAASSPATTAAPRRRLIVGHFSRCGGPAGSLVIDRPRRSPGSSGVVRVCCAGPGRGRRLQDQERSKRNNQGRRR